MLLMMFYMMFYLFMVYFLILVIFLFNTLIEEKFYILEWNIFSFYFNMDIKMFFYFDYLSNLFMIVVSLISAVVFYFSKDYMESDKMKEKFIFFTFLFVMCMYLMILSLNIIIILLGWDGLGIVSYFLVVHYNSDNSHYSGIITVVTNRIGDIGIIFMMFMMCSLFSFDVIIIDLFSENFFNLVLIMLIMSAFTKSAQFPFSSWLPLAMAAPTPISSLVHSSTLVTAGVYLFIRFSSFFQNNSVFVFNVLLLTLITVFNASLSALMEMDIKKIIAYSTLSQLSLMMMAVVMGNDILSFFHVLTHAMFKALMFLCSGIFIHECFDNQDVRSYSMTVKTNIFVVSIFFICSLSLMGFPFLSGFYSKDLILELMYSMNFNVFYIFVVMLSTSFTTFYSVRLICMSLLMGSNSSKMLFSMAWSNMYDTLILLFFGVLFTGSVLNWLIMDKLVVFFMTEKVKILNLALILGGILIMIFLKGMFLNQLFLNMFVGMFYLTKSQGDLMNSIFSKSMYFTLHMEYALEYLFVLKPKYLISYFSNLLMFFKMFNYLLGFSLILVVLLYL